MGSEEDRPEEMQVSPTQPSAGTAFSSVSVDTETGGMRRWAGCFAARGCTAPI